MRTPLRATRDRLAQFARRVSAGGTADAAPERLTALRAEAERLSADLLAEPEPHYPADEEATARLEEAFRERHLRDA